ncbi:MAG: T9SS type A sorting domain-containing protein, partial [Chitinophagaceae bacterium]
LAVSKSSFDCSNIGDNNVILTVTDAAGNSSNCTAVVSVIGIVPSCTISAIPSSNVYTGGIPTNIYLGYGPQSVTLNVNPIGGSSFSYSWLGNNLSCSDCSATVFTPTTKGVYNFTVTVTNNFGCTTTCTIIVCVLDIRIPGTKDKKVYLCHAPSGNVGHSQTLALNINAVKAHLINHPDDKLGMCGQDPCSQSEMMITEKSPAIKSSSIIPFQVVVAPNPSISDFTLYIESNNELPVSIRIMDVYGRIISDHMNTPGLFTKKIGSTLLPGIYFAHVSQGNERISLKLVKH